MTPCLDGWAAVSDSGRGIDPTVRRPPNLVGRRVRAFVVGRGPVVTSEVAAAARRGGAWYVRTVTGSTYALADSIWSQISASAVRSER